MYLGIRLQGRTHGDGDTRQAKAKEPPRRVPCRLQLQIEQFFVSPAPPPRLETILLTMESENEHSKQNRQGTRNGFPSDVRGSMAHSVPACTCVLRYGNQRQRQRQKNCPLPHRRWNVHWLEPPSRGLCWPCIFGGEAMESMHWFRTDGARRCVCLHYLRLTSWLARGADQVRCMSAWDEVRCDAMQLPDAIAREGRCTTMAIGGAKAAMAMDIR